MTLYALKTALPPTPERAAQGAPQTGWIHEGNPPWRVIAFPTLEDASKLQGVNREPAEYVGDEDVVLWDELLPPPARSTAQADAQRLHYHDDLGRIRCPGEYTEEAGRMLAVRCPHLFDVLRYEGR